MGGMQNFLFSFQFDGLFVGTRDMTFCMRIAYKQLYKFHIKYCLKGKLPTWQ